jgi:hypothetical protein
MDIIKKVSWKKEAEILYKMYVTLGELKDQVIHGRSAFRNGKTVITITGNHIQVEYQDGKISEYTHIEE